MAASVNDASNRPNLSVSAQCSICSRSLGGRGLGAALWAKHKTLNASRQKTAFICFSPCLCASVADSQLPIDMHPFAEGRQTAVRGRQTDAPSRQSSSGGHKTLG